MKGMRRVILIILLLLCSSIISTSASAQNPIPGISLDCEPKDVIIDVYPGSPRMNSIICTAENPSLYVEDVRIESSISDNVIEISSAGSLTVPASGSIEFTVTFRANQGLSPATYSWNITATVTAANGVIIPDAIAPTDTDSGDVIIAEYARIAISMSTMTRYIAAGETANASIEISNVGNAAAKMGCTYSSEPVATTDETYELFFDSFSHYEEVEANSQYTIFFNFTGPSISEPVTFEIDVICKIYDDVDELIEGFNVEVEPTGGGGLSSLGNSLGIDNSTLMMIGGVGAGVVALMVIMFVGLKLKAKRRRVSNSDVWDDELFEEDDDEFDFEDL